MLADAITQHGITGLRDYTDDAAMVDRITRAPKFYLSGDFACVAEDLSENYDSLIKAVPFCRLPYPEIWLEVAQADRPHFLRAPIHEPAIQSIPRRVGFLCTATNRNLSAWVAHLFWVMAADPRATNAALMAITCDMNEVQLLPRSAIDDLDHNYGSHPGWDAATESTRLELTSRCRPVLSDFATDFPSVPNLDPGEYAKLIARIGRLDWAGEVGFLMATIALLNSPNAAEREYVDNTRQNCRRQKRGDRPLASHYVLRIHPHLKRRVGDKSGEGRASAALRAHMVRGHWKVRRSGIFFWHPFLRSNPQHGTVSKDYAVT